VGVVGSAGAQSVLYQWDGDGGVITDRLEIVQLINADPEAERTELPEDENPFRSLVPAPGEGPLYRAVSELAQDYRRRVQDARPGQLVRLVKEKLLLPEVQEDEVLFANFTEWTQAHHPDDLLRREDTVKDAYRSLKAETPANETVEALQHLWTVLEEKGLSRGLERPAHREPSEKDLQLICWELVVPKS